MKWLTTETFRVRLLVPSGLTVAGLVGGAVGYVVATKIQEKKFRELADKEIQEAKVYYQGMYSRPTLVAEDLEEDVLDVDVEEAQEQYDQLPVEVKDRLIQDAVEAMGAYRPPAPKAEDSGPPQVVVNNIFANPIPPGEEVLLALLADRDPSEPYIITKHEYYENEPDNEQKRFTFYDGDKILVDDQDEYNPIQNTDAVVGDDNLLRFGYGSGDEHTLYVRNETLDPPLDFWIVRSTGSYMVEVMGGYDEDQPHLKHSQTVRKFRNFDD